MACYYCYHCINVLVRIYEAALFLKFPSFRLLLRRGAILLPPPSVIDVDLQVKAKSVFGHLLCIQGICILKAIKDFD